MGHMRSVEKRKVRVMKCLRSVVGASRMDRDGNAEVRRRTGIGRELASREDHKVLIWLWTECGKMDECRMTRRVLIAEVNIGRVRGIPRLDWMTDVKVTFGNTGMTL